MPTEAKIAYRDGDVDLHGLLVTPDDANGGAVLLIPAVFGMSEHPKDRARRVAALGYTVLVADLYGAGAHYPTLAEAMPHGETLMGDPAAARARLDAALEALRAQPNVNAARIAAIGYCFGGTGALELAYAGADLKAVVSFHGGFQLSDPEGAKRVKGSILVCTGAEDPLVPEVDVAEFQRQMRTGTADWQVVTYGNTLHAFTDPAADGFGVPVAGYSPSADRRSWQAMAALLAERLA